MPYDPQAIARYYRWRPWLLLWRTFQILSSLGRFVWGLKWDQWTRQTERNRFRRAIQLRRVLTGLGPTFIKIGQALSTRPDLVRKEFLEELILLQDQLPPFPNKKALALIERELGRPVSELYRSMSPQPVAAASLGQVYRGELWDGDAIAIKVQRPKLVPKISLDLAVIRKAVVWFGPFLPLNLGHNLSVIVDEFGTKLFEEIDYLNEGRNAERFADNFAAYPDVKVPKIYWEYTSQRVLTLEWIEGTKLTASQCMVNGKRDPDALVRTGVVSSLRQLLEFGFFHADPHPGNLFAMPDGRMAYIDFGMMDQLDQVAKETLVDSVVHLINQDYRLLAQDFVKLGFLTPETDIRPIVPALESVFSEIIDVSVKDFNFQTITDQFSGLMYEYPFRLPAKFALIIRSLVTQEGVALCLNPDFKIVEVAYPYVARRLLAGETPEFQRRLLEVLFKDGKFQWQRLENLIEIARTDDSFDLIPTAQFGLQYLFSGDGGFFLKQIVLALTEDERLHTEEVSRLWDLVKEDFQPQRLLGAAFGALASFSEEAVANWPPVVAITTAQKELQNVA
ncbi:ABC1 kinase family protein [Acaryochloris thomasi]|nr:AarF/ABC1/UbiB kinase family protein [Acaryochloris thomasi]